MDRKTIGSRLRQARESAELSQEEVARRLGKSQSAISDYERARLGLELPDLIELAKILGQPVSFFLDEESTDLQHRAEGEIRRARKMMESALKHLQVPPPGSEPVKWVPLVAGSPAGEVVETSQVEQVPVPSSLVTSKDIFALEILGDSMVGRGLLNGDRVIVNPNRSPQDGDIVVVRRDNERVVLIYHQDESGSYLVAAVPGSPRLPLEEATIIGVVTGWFIYHNNNG